MKNILVPTISGNNVPRENCRKIQGMFYEINKDCFFVEGKWNRLNNGKIVKNYSTNTYVKTSYAEENLHFGIVKINPVVVGYFNPIQNFVEIPFKKNSTSVLTFENQHIADFTEFPSNFETMFSTSKYPVLKCMSKDIAYKLGYVYAFNSDELVPNTKEFTAKFKKSLGGGYGSLNYTSDRAIPNASERFKELNAVKPSKKFFNLAHAFGDMSFGIEFETRNGYVSRPILDELGLIPVKDGSLRLDNGNVPYEFVTIPLQGNLGFTTLDKICDVLSERTSIDNRCSLHLHLGNVPTDELFIISFVKLVHMVQKELYEMFPLYKQDSSIIGGNKNYCKPLPNTILPKTLRTFEKLSKLELEEYISYNFNKIYHFVSCGQTPNSEYNRKILSHPIQQEKWHVDSRYYLVNLVSLMFKSFRTIEFRLHTPTTNKYKVFYWMLISGALVKYATNYQREIISNSTIALSTVINTIYSPELATKINEYIRLRKNWFEGPKDVDGSLEFEGDSKFKFIDV